VREGAFSCQADLLGARGGTDEPEEHVARPDKVAAVDEVKQNLVDSAATLLTHYRGLSVPELQQLRVELRKANASYRVIKNTLSRRAMADAGIEGLEDLLEGPTALVFCEQDPVGPAKALKAFAKDHPELLVRGGYLDGEVLDEGEAIKLADLASREELLAELAGLMQGALTNTVRLLQAPLEQQGRLMQALIDAGGAGAEESEEAAEPADDAEEPAAQDAPGTAATADEAGGDAPDDVQAADEPAPEPAENGSEGEPSAPAAEAADDTEDDDEA
jgi:large subunit ribosomal protein L10